MSVNSTGAAGYTVRAGTPSDTPRILALVRRSLGEGGIPRDDGFWRWKHEQSPFGPSACLVAEDGEDIVGLRVFMRWRWQSKGTVVHAVRAVDTATDARWRGRGIFSRLTRELVNEVQREGVTLIYNTPNRYSLPGYLKMGWRSLGRVSLWIRPLRPVQLLRNARRLRADASATHVPQAETEPHAGASLVALLEARELDGFLADARGLDVRLCTPLSREFIAWRYARIPGFRYEARWDVGPDRQVIVVYRRKVHGALTELRIAELAIGRGARSRRAARHLIGEVLTSSDCDMASARASGPHARAVLAANGFITVPRLGPTFTVRPLNDPPRGADPLRLRSWAPSIGDLEIF